MHIVLFCCALATMPPQHASGSSGVPRLYCTPDSHALINAVNDGTAPPQDGAPAIRWCDALGTVGNYAGDVGAAALRYLGFHVSPDGTLVVQQDGFARRLLHVLQEYQQQNQTLAQFHYNLQQREQLAAAHVAAADERVRAVEAQLSAQAVRANALADEKRELLTKLSNASRKAERAQSALPAAYDRLALDTQHNVSALFLPNPPDSQRHLHSLLLDQAKCRTNVSGTCVWSEEVLQMCVSVALTSRSAYASLRASLVMTLPSIDTVLRHAAVTKSVSGHSAELYESVRAAAAALPAWMREVALIFDEVSLVGELAFKVVNGEYRFFGMIDRHDLRPLFSNPGRLATEDEAALLKAGMATHALVFQVAELSGAQRPRFRRVCGIHAVAGLTADMVDTLFWETVGHLAEDCELQVLVAVCDGAGCNRLWMKMQSMGPRARNTPNAFSPGMESVLNRWGPPDSVIFLISDPSHGGKKARNNLNSSGALADTTKNMRVPAWLLIAVLSFFQPVGAVDTYQGATVGIEWYFRIFGRLYFLMASGTQDLYFSSDPTVDTRIQEMLDILRILRAWHDCTEHYGTLEGTNSTVTHSHFISQQLYYDIQTMIEGFIGLLAYRSAQWGRNGAVRARCISQDSLESLFGRLRFACGGGNTLGMFRACHALPLEDVRTQERWRRKSPLGGPAASGTNSGAVHGSGGGGLPHSARITLPHDFDAQLAAALAVTHMPQCYPIHWSALAIVQKEDEKAFLEQKRGRHLPWLQTAKHIVLTGFSKMKVGWAIDVLRPETANILQSLRLGLLPDW